MTRFRLYVRVWHRWRALAVSWLQGGGATRTPALDERVRRSPGDNGRIVVRADVIKMRRASERHRLHSGGQNLWLTFFPEHRSEPLAHGFGSLAALNEGVLPPEGTMLRSEERRVGKEC